ncbi:UTP--glucose-1-phosphate uridylyltransferase GalU [Bacillus sp. CBEL-1]|uniref:UTP--glucose-1-phosphate uridylyltransferase GalU n=1 Tax=Bacillaceae TaxID=186817 RepID=UPI00104B026C|nr:UTP--glucose-1-phosphate uridylyltransferase GalU [Bacillus sp. CBEL-1]TDB54914.1 UTP--glucose-1-phosphate uridylyltransferase GalU [Bacillus sp. CBEL-1]
MNVRKAVIPVGGLGTRFLPATKAIPKEMLPIVDKPAVQYIVEEAVEAGIESIIFITGKHKKAIEDHFDKSVQLEHLLEEKGKYELLENVQRISKMASVHYIRQQEPQGLGHAILCAEKFIGDEPFAVLLGDDVMVGETPALKQLIKTYEEVNQSVIGVKEVKKEDVSKYGIIKASSAVGDVYSVEGVVEKPKLEQAPSNVAIMGRYILTPSIFQSLKKIEKGVGNELQLTDAINDLSQYEQVFSVRLKGSRFDIGGKFGYLQAMIEMALKREDLRNVFLPYLQQIVQQEQWKTR